LLNITQDLPTHPGGGGGGGGGVSEDRTFNGMSSSGPAAFYDRYIQPISLPFCLYVSAILFELKYIVHVKDGEKAGTKTLL